MTIRFDDKGKFFTDVVSKEAIPVLIQTVPHRIQGVIYVLPGERLKDGLNAEDEFVAVTDARVYDPLGKLLFYSTFLAVRRDHISWIAPLSDINEIGGSGGDG